MHENKHFIFKLADSVKIELKLSQRYLQAELLSINLSDREIMEDNCVVVHIQHW